MPKAKNPAPRATARKPPADRPRRAPRPDRPAAPDQTLAPPDPSRALRDDGIQASDLTLHDLFAQQTAAMLDRADLSDEQKQSILIGMSCPCCGAGGFSFTAKLRR